MFALRHHRLPLALRVFTLVLLALVMVLQPVLASVAELHELAHDPTGGHAHVGHGEALAEELPFDEEDGAATLHTILHFTHCCGHSTISTPALQLAAFVPTPERPLMDLGQLPLHPRAFAPYRPPIA